MHKAVIDALLSEREGRQAVALLTWLKSGETRIVHQGDFAALPGNAELLDQAFARDRSQIIDGDDGEVFIHIFNPPLRMVMVGAVHTAQYLAPIARMAGYHVTIVDPRSAFAAQDRFSGVKLVARWPEEVLPEIGLDPRTAFLTLTHDPKIDDPALVFALASDAFYIGALGSKRTHAKRHERFKSQGVSEAAMVRIHAPIGLNIGAVGPVEIAMSIMAEITAVLRGKAGGNT